jgi:hypothetical protein
MIRCVSAAARPSGTLIRRNITDDPNAANSATNGGSDAQANEADSDAVRKPRISPTTIAPKPVHGPRKPAAKLLPRCEPKVDARRKEVGAIVTSVRPNSSVQPLKSTATQNGIATMPDNGLTTIVSAHSVKQIIDLIESDVESTGTTALCASITPLAQRRSAWRRRQHNC